MAGKIRTLQYGCGTIGCAVARLASGRSEIEYVGAADIDREKAGRDLGDVAGLGRDLGVKVSGDSRALLERTRPDLVFLTTGSHLAAVLPQLKEIIAAGANIVSTAEELA